MRKLSVPVLIDTVTDENLSDWIKMLKKSKVDRVLMRIR